MNPKLCTETYNHSHPASIETYLSLGGYDAWKNIVQNKMPRSKIIEKVKDSGLRGKGGAGFLTGLKWSFIPLIEGQKYLVCNSDESEPGTCKDRDILRYNPHSIIEGMLIACYAIGASVGYNYLRGEFMDQQWKVFNEALKEAYKFKLIGNNIISSGATSINGRPHAEFNAIKQVKKNLNGRRIYLKLHSNSNDKTGSYLVCPFLYLTFRTIKNNSERKLFF